MFVSDVFLWHDSVQAKHVRTSQNEDYFFVASNMSKNLRNIDQNPGKQHKNNDIIHTWHCSTEKSQCKDC